MKKIGILSDTHSYWDEKYLHYFEPCDEIWHAGDIGSLEVAQKLAAFRPLRAVCGSFSTASPPCCVCRQYSKWPIASPPPSAPRRGRLRVASRFLSASCARWLSTMPSGVPWPTMPQRPRSRCATSHPSSTATADGHPCSGYTSSPSAKPSTCSCSPTCKLRR